MTGTTGRTARPRLRIEPWSEDDYGLLVLSNAPEMTEHVGGPETEEQLRRRQRRYVEPAAPGKGRMFRVVLAPGEDGEPEEGGAGEKIGSVGYWERSWRDEAVYEAGWGILPPFQGRGLAAEAVAAVLAHARAHGVHRYLHAFPSVSNPSSNSLCRRAGFTSLGECAFEYPPGTVMRCHDWRYDLREPAGR